MLIVRTPEVPVTLVVPAIRAAEVDGHGEGTALLTVTDSTSHEVMSSEVDIAAVTTFSLNIVDLIIGLANGQYTYTLAQSGVELSRGVLQVGVLEPEVSIHEYNPEIRRYEQ